MSAPVKNLIDMTLNEIDSVVRFNRHRDDDQKIRPTIQAYGAWQYAFDYFNATLFGGELPDALITITRKANARGYFWAEKFENNASLITHEISMNPVHLKEHDDREALSTFVHEMAHLWRHVYGPLNKRGGKGSGGYHDLVWADKMEALGLTPRNIGSGGGERTGYRVTHSIIDGGPFDQSCAALLASGYAIDWRDAKAKRKPSDPEDGEIPPKKKDRIKFNCCSCSLNAWAKPTARLTCTRCVQPMTPCHSIEGARHDR